MKKIVLHFYRKSIGRMLLFITLFLGMGNVAVAQQTDFEKEISKRGFDTDDLTDWSNQKKINIEIPSCAYVNISGISSLPPRKSSNYHAWVEFYDGAGNYFKKRVLLNLQGNSSTTWPKKGYKLDFCEDEWVGDKTPDIKFGNWVKQDAFHIKAYYLDKFRGTGAISYKVYDMVISGRGERPWNRANLEKPDLEARCVPDGFPVIVYFNGNFHGVYSWQLTKHRKNMNIDKNNPLQIHIEGGLNETSLFAAENISWSSIGVRCPKSLYSMDGSVYDDDWRTELMDETSPYYNPEAEDEEVREIMLNTVAVKHSIEQLRNHWFEIQELVQSGASKEEIREEIEKRFDVPSIMDYLIHNLLTNNLDGLVRNWQWFTYDGYKWFVAPYDLDATFGFHTNYCIVFPPENYALGSLLNRTWLGYKNPMALIQRYFKDDLCAYYANIRDRGLLTADGIISLFNDWYYRVGEDNYDKEWEKWNQCGFAIETILNPNWQTYPWDNQVYSKSPYYSSTVTYNEGDIVRDQFRLWQATGTTTGVAPASQVGCRDSIGRMYTWVPIHLGEVDKWMKYSPITEMASFNLVIPASGWVTVCVPFKFDIPDGTEVYNVIGFDAETSCAKLETVTAVEANKPYLIKGTPGTYLISGEKEEADAEDPDYLVNGLLHGTYTVYTATAGDYLLQMHESIPGFYTAEDNVQTTVSPNSAYMNLDLTLNKPSVVYLDTEVPDKVTINITSAGIGTYCSNYPLSFTDRDDIKAYVVFAYNNKTGNIRTARVYDVPAKTGIIVKGDMGSYDISMSTSPDYLLNMLVGTTEEIYLTKTDGDKTNFVLSVQNGSPSFNRLSNDGYFPANRAYLQVPTALFPAGTNSFGLEFEDDADGIEDVLGEAGNGTIYSITGVKTDNPIKGVYIKNGKKVVVY